MFFSSIKWVNKLVSKGMSNIYVKVTIEKIDFRSLKNLSLGQLLESSNSSRYHWIKKLPVAT